jgi:dimethylglycine dehydrogenase
MRSHARVVIVGGGVMGCGLLYHLALEGWRDILLVEKGELTSGSTWHAAGQCPLFNGSLNVTKVHLYGNQLYAALAERTGYGVSWHPCGGLRLATTDEELNWFQHVYGLSKLVGYDAHIIGPEEISSHHPYVDAFGVRAAFLTTSDGHVAPADVANAMAAGARALGAEILKRTRVTDIERLPTGEWRVATDQGDVTCQHVVNCAGSYAREVGSWTGLQVPLANLLHHYVVSEPLAELTRSAKELPVVRDPYSNCYLRQEGHGLLIGPYETDTAHECWGGEHPPWDFESELISPELDRLVPWLEKAAQRLPLFGRAGIKTVISGAITHTPDGTCLSGPAAGAPNYWMHCGASIGIAQGAGAGKFLAQWMVHGQAEINMREFDPRRFGDWASQNYTATTAIADYQHMYHCFPPGQQHQVGRRLRNSTLYERLARSGAQFGQVFGWERARWFSPSGEPERFSWARSNWWQAVSEEALAVRERVGLMDLSTFSKFEISGPDAYDFLQRVCANRIPVRQGAIVLTHLLTPAGFIESELTVTRLAADRFYILSAAMAQVHDYDELTRRKQPQERVAIVDVTDDYGVLVLAGPEARGVLAGSTAVGLGSAEFPWLTGRSVEVAGVKGVRVLRISYVGELAWELHVPMPQMPAVYRALMRSGGMHGIRHFGTYAMNSLRMEKAYRAWGGELTNELTLIEAGMRRFVDLDKEFVGKAGVVKSLRDGPRTQLAYLEVDAIDRDCVGNEPVILDGEVVGVTTGGAYGFAVRKSLAFAYLQPTALNEVKGLEIMLGGERRHARLIPEPAWDTANLRPRS